MVRMRSLAVIFGVGAALATAGCGNGNPSASAGAGGGASAVTAAATLPGTPVATIDATSALKFEPDTTTAKVGDVILFKNTSSGIPHNVTFDDASASSATSATLQFGDTWSVKFSTAGTYTYNCTFHPGMKGTLTISS